MPVYRQSAGAGGVPVALVGQVNPLNGTDGAVQGTGLADVTNGLTDGDFVVVYDNTAGVFTQTGLYMKSGSGFTTFQGTGTINYTESFQIVSGSPSDPDNSVLLDTGIGTGP